MTTTDQWTHDWHRAEARKSAQRKLAEAYKLTAEAEEILNNNGFVTESSDAGAALVYLDSAGAREVQS